MREIFTDKSFRNRKKLLAAKLLLIIALFVFFAPLIILPFFNHPCADDYICGYQLKEKGFWAYQSFIYQHWGGRFAATFTGSLFALNNYLYDHYYMHSILLLIINFFSIISVLWKSRNADQYSKNNCRSINKFFHFNNFDFKCGRMQM